MSTTYTVDSATSRATPTPMKRVTIPAIKARKGDPEAEPLARNVQPLEIEPEKFNYRLVRAELAFEDYGTIVAHCRIDLGPVRVVPYTLLPPVQ